MGYQESRIGSHADKKFKSCLTAFQYGCFYCTGVTGDGNDYLVGMAGADIRGHVFSNGNSSGFYGIVSHNKSDCGGEPAMNPNASPSGVPKALWIAGPALAEKANSDVRIR